MGSWYNQYKTNRDAAINEIMAGKKGGPPGKKPGDELAEALSFLRNFVKPLSYEIEDECSIMWVEFYKEYRPNHEITFVDTSISTESKRLRKSVSSSVLSLAVEFAHTEEYMLMADEIADGEGARWKFGYKTNRDAAIDEIMAGKKDGPPGKKPGDELAEALSFLRNSGDELAEALSFLRNFVKPLLDEIEAECSTCTIRWVEFYKEYRTNSEITFIDTSILTELRRLRKSVSSSVLSLAVKFAWMEEDMLMADEIADGEGARWKFGMAIKIGKG